MYEYGHPLHAFDAKCVEGKKIIVRKSKPKEEFPALNNHNYTLTGAELVIADANKPIALAGVIGGKNSHITEETTDIILEAACFNSSITRRTSHNLKIFTDSSYRFERGMAEHTCETIATKASNLIMELAEGKMVRDMIDIYPYPKERRVIKVRPKRVKRLLAINIDNHKIINYMKNLGCRFLKADTEYLHFEVPPYRIDLVREVDILEEIIRLYGYNNVGESTEIPVIMNKDVFYARRNIKNILINNGFYEAVNITFTDPAFLDMLNLNENDSRRDTVKIQNPQSENTSILRSTLIPQLLKNLLLNINHGTESLKLFEMNKVFSRKYEKLASEKWRIAGVLMGRYSPVFWNEKNANLSFFDVKGVVENILDYLHINNLDFPPIHEVTDELAKAIEPTFYLPNNGFYIYSKKYKIGSIGKLDPTILKSFDIDCEVFAFDLDLDKMFELADFRLREYVDVPKLPVVQRDLSFVVSEQYLLKDIMHTIRETNSKIIKNIVPFDQFKGSQIKEGFRSISVSISLISEMKTLTDEQINTIIDKIIARLKEKFNIELR
jgi:phenylalanyl-tRNA synthetase beta chain